jgi:hypothetical protein
MVQSAALARKPDEAGTRVDCSMHTEQGEIHRCPICGAVVVDRFGPWPLKSTVPGPPPPEGATVMENRLVCSADSDHDLNAD